MNILGFTGMPWSGKSEAVAIAKKKGIPVFRMGDFVWDEVRKRKLTLNSDNVGIVAHEMREKYGNTIWAKKTVNAINNMTRSRTIVIDGIRSIDEVQYFRSHLSDSFRLIAITAPDTIRHERAKLRKRADDSINEIDILKRDEREKQWGITQVIQSADVKIDNTTSLNSFSEKVSVLLSEN